MSEKLRTLKISVEAPATLTLTYTDPATREVIHRPPTTEELANLGLRDKHSMYEATQRNIEALGLDPSEGIGSELRYFVEHSTHWDHEIDYDGEDEFATLRTALKDHTDG